MVGQNGHCLGKVRAGTPAESHVYLDHRAMKMTSTKVLETFLDLPTLGRTVEFSALMAAYRLLRPDLKHLGMGRNRIWVKADKMDKFSMIKDHITLRNTFGKYWTVIPTREEWNKDWPNRLRKGQVWFTDGPCNQQKTGTGICKCQSKIQWHISLGQDTTAFQAEVAAILDCVISCLRKGLGKKQITIYTDNQATVVALQSVEHNHCL